MMSEEEIKDWFFERYESDTPSEEWDMLDIWEEVCRLRLNDSIIAKMALSCLIENEII